MCFFLFVFVVCFVLFCRPGASVGDVSYTPKPNLLQLPKDVGDGILQEPRLLHIGSPSPTHWFAKKKHMPLFEEIRETSQDMFGSDIQVYFPWDVSRNSSKNGFLHFSSSSRPIFFGKRFAKKKHTPPVSDITLHTHYILLDP